jgi:heptosyltransferase-2
MPRILVIAPNWIGDMLMAQPLLAQVKAYTAGSEITVVAPQWVAPTLRYMPEVDHIITTNLTHGKFNLRTRWHLAKTLRAQHFEACYVLPNSWKSALLPWLAGIPLRIGYLGEMRYGLLNQYLPNPNKAQRPPMLQHYAALSKFAPIQSASKRTVARLNAPMTVLPTPALSITDNEIQQTAQLFNIPPEQPLLVLCPGAEFGPAKRWPVSHFAELAQLAQRALPNVHVIALGSHKDKPIAQAIGHNVHNLCGATRLEQAIALLARANAVVANDSGLMHISAALNRPLIALFGSSDPRHTPPHSAQATPLWLHLPCSPCYQRTCPLQHLRCLQDISPTHVMSYLQTIFERVEVRS